MVTNKQDAAVIGGAVSGLAAAHRLNKIEKISDVTLFERQEYDEKRVECGEAINDTSLIPIEKTEENGFVNNVSGFQLQIYSGTNRNPDEKPYAVSNLNCDPGYICERDLVEKSWAESLEQDGVQIETGTPILTSEFESIVESYDYVIDATGQPSLSLKARDATHEYTGDMVALNATVEGNFKEYLDWPRIFFEGYIGYSWAFPKSENQANVGIGWAGSERPDDYMKAFETAAKRNGFPIPARGDTNIYTIPKGPSLDPSRVYFPEDNIFLVGDAAGIANRYQGEGICQAIRSSYLLCDLIKKGSESQYPKKLYNSMKSEYRLASLMRGVWVEHEDPELMATVAESLEGLTIDDITRSPRNVIKRVLRNPTVAAQLVTDQGMVKRFVNAYTDNWEYNSSSA